MEKMQQQCFILIICGVSVVFKSGSKGLSWPSQVLIIRIEFLKAIITINNGLFENTLLQGFDSRCCFVS
jgi:hypothetical protein